MENLKKQYKPELYDRIKDNGYNYAKIIIPIFQKTFDIESVLDVGCGGASFLHGCFDMGLDVFGVDGDHVESSLQINKRLVKYVNLEIPLHIKGKFDLCVSLEVAEHLNIKYSDIFVDSICKHSDNILFSAAQTGQPGINHINCQPLEFWIDKFMDRDYIVDKTTTDLIRQDKNIYNLYRRNSMVFKKGGSKCL